MDAVEEYHVDAACPRLGLAADRRTRFTFPHPSHRCHATPTPTVIEPRQQEAYCLSPGFRACIRYGAWRGEGAEGTQQQASPEVQARPAVSPTSLAAKSPARQRRSATRNTIDTPAPPSQAMAPPNKPPEPNTSG